MVVGTLVAAFEPPTNVSSDVNVAWLQCEPGAPVCMLEQVFPIVGALATSNTGVALAALGTMEVEM